MRNRRVDGNDDIQQRDDGGRIHKILKVVAEMDDTRMRAQHCRITGRSSRCRLTNWTYEIAKSCESCVSRIERLRSLSCAALPAQTIPTLDFLISAKWRFHSKMRSAGASQGGGAGTRVRPGVNTRGRPARGQQRGQQGKGTPQ